MCWHLYRGCQSGYFWCCFYLQGKEDWQREHFGSSHSGAVEEPTLICGVNLDQQVLRSCWHWLCCSAWWQTQWCCYPECPGLWSLTSTGWLWLSCPWKQQLLWVKGIFGDTLPCLFFSSLSISSHFIQARKGGVRMPKARWTCHPNTAHPVEHPCGGQQATGNPGTCRKQPSQPRALPITWG